MKILSSSISDYIDINYNIDEFNSIDELSNIYELTLNAYDYSMSVAPFYPNELTYFKSLKHCTFMNFEINEEILISLNKLDNLKELVFDNCTGSINYIFNNKLESLTLENSSVSLINIGNKKTIKKMLILESETIDIENIILYENLESLKILNCNIDNSSMLRLLKPNCKIELIGCVLDNKDVLNELNNVIYNPEQYNKID
ncbi:MAG: hypothetical protein J6D28_00405 [Bacilli bacterium]|nr:hypothetical protein [Bacilli bacterium]